MRAALAFLMFFCAVLSAQGGELKINTLVDTLIEEVVESLVESNSQTMPIDDLEQDFTVLFVKGGVKAARGVFSDLSTVVRTGDATLELHDDHASVKISLGLKDLQLYFQHCRAWLGALSTSEKIAVYVKENSISADITLHINGDDCTTTLDSVTLDRLGDIEVDLKSLGFIRYVAANFVDWIISFFDDNIRVSVEATLQDTLKEKLQEVDFCSLIQ